MPNTKFDSKSFNPEAFAYKVGTVPNLKMNELKKSAALAANPDIKRVFGSQNGTLYSRIAVRGLIDGDAVNYDGQTDITATSTKTFEQGVVVVGRAKAWVEKDFSYDITGGIDFMDNVAKQIAEYKDGLDQKTLLAILRGIFAMTGDTKNEEFVSRHTTTVDGSMTASTLNSATNKACGANKKSFSLVFMHSDVSTGLENLNLIERLKYTDKEGIQRSLELGTWNGKLVVVDDDMPTEEGYFDAAADTAGAVKIVADSATPKDGEIKLSDAAPYFGAKTLAAGDFIVPGTRYTTYALGKGAISYEDVGAKVPYEMDRDPKVNGGEDTLYIRQRKCFAPFGISYEKEHQASNSPTDAELANGANWSLVHSGEEAEAGRSYINHKAIAIARIFSRG